MRLIVPIGRLWPLLAYRSLIPKSCFLAVKLGRIKCDITAAGYESPRPSSFRVLFVPPEPLGLLLLPFRLIPSFGLGFGFGSGLGFLLPLYSLFVDDRPPAPSSWEKFAVCTVIPPLNGWDVRLARCKRPVENGDRCCHFAERCESDDYHNPYHPSPSQLCLYGGSIPANTEPAIGGFS